MDSPLVISFIIFIAAVGIGLWSQYCLPRLSDSRNILFHQDSFTGHFGPGQCLTQYGSILNALQAARRASVARQSSRAACTSGFCALFVRQ